nr:transposase, MuDR [Ipomoea batatas]GME11290.1 transposase, MuDR [Ipomoea batatas]
MANDCGSGSGAGCYTFTLKLRHGGYIEQSLPPKYVAGKVQLFTNIDVDEWGFITLKEKFQELGYSQDNPISFFTVNSTTLVELVDDFQTCCLANYVVRPKEVEVWIIGAAIGVDEEELEISGEEYDEGSTEGSDFEDDLQFDRFIDANVEYGGVGAGVESNNEEAEEMRQQGIVGENVDLFDDREIMDSDNEVQEDMSQAVGNEGVEVGNGCVNEVGNLGVEVGNGCVNEVGNEGVHDIGNLVEIQVNIEGENEIVNEGQTVNEPVNAIEDGLEGQTENEAENQPANQPMKDSYGNLDDLNEVQEDDCTNLADPLLETWDAIQIPWERSDRTASRDRHAFLLPSSVAVARGALGRPKSSFVSSSSHETCEVRTHRAIFATPTPEMTYATNTRNDARTGPSLRPDNEFLR